MSAARAEHVEVLVEEPSMEAALRVLLPSMLGAVTFEVYPYQCKDDLLAKLPSRLKGYASWIPASWRIVVLVDRDDDDCFELKRTLENAAATARLPSRSAPRPDGWVVVNRLAVEELEAWYFGDWAAVRAGYPRAKMTVPQQAAYRDPDGIRGGTWEAFERELQRVGYFPGRLRKIEAARTIAPAMVPERNTSRSFQVLRSALDEIASGRA